MSKPLPESLLSLIRTEVRSQHPYIVPGARPVPVKLNQNESPFDIPSELKKELLDSFLNVQFNRYPAEQPSQLMAALESNLGVEHGSVLVGNGSNELTYTLGMCFIHSGDPVVVPRPMFALYESMINLHGGQPIGIAPKADLQFDVEGILSAIKTHQPPLVIITTPNNPTGLAMQFDDVKRIVEAAPGFVVVDEAYHEFNPGESAVGLISTHPNVIVLRTLSKAFGLAGLRLGYMVAQPALITEMMKSRLPFMVDRLSEHVALSLLSNDQLIADQIEIILSNTRSLTAELQSRLALDVLPSQTNFVLFKADRDPVQFLNDLADRGTLVRNMGGYPELKGYLRVTSGTEAENQAFLNALDSVLLS
ncbi:histidinol-phosphate transaminase [bacterium]|nr:histidinol-phosphate transaminase [bacterium]